MTVDLERVLERTVLTGIVGVVVSFSVLGIYLAVAVTLITSGRSLAGVPVLSLTGDPILNGLLALLGVSIVTLCGSLVFLAHLTESNDIDIIIVTFAGALGVGFGASVVRYTLPVVIEYVTSA